MYALKRIQNQCFQSFLSTATSCCSLIYSIIYWLRILPNAESLQKLTMSVKMSTVNKAIIKIESRDSKKKKKNKLTLQVAWRNSLAIKMKRDISKLLQNRDRWTFFVFTKKVVSIFSIKSRLQKKIKLGGSVLIVDSLIMLSVFQAIHP